MQDTALSRNLEIVKRPRICPNRKNSNISGQIMPSFKISFFFPKKGCNFSHIFIHVLTNLAQESGHINVLRIFLFKKCQPLTHLGVYYDNFLTISNLRWNAFLWFSLVLARLLEAAAELLKCRVVCMAVQLSICLVPYTELPVSTFQSIMLIS